MAGPAVLDGFANPVFDAQRTFRRVLDAFARPGIMVPVSAGLPAFPLPPAALAALLALIDIDTPLWIDPSIDGSLSSYLRFHTGARTSVDPQNATFAVLASPEGLRTLDWFACGTAMSPELSTTVIVAVEGFDGDLGAELDGPGFASPRTIAPSGFDDEIWQILTTNHASFPSGVDVLLACGSHLVGLPRSTSIRPLPRGS